MLLSACRQSWMTYCLLLNIRLALRYLWAIFEWHGYAMHMAIYIILIPRLSIGDSGFFFLIFSYFAMICISCTEPDEAHCTVAMGPNNYSYGHRLRELLAKKVKMSNTYHTARTGSARFQHIRQWMTDLEERYGAVTSYYMSEMLQPLTTSNHLKNRNKNGHNYILYL